jgi:anti-sigma factor RsiW
MQHIEEEQLSAFIDSQLSDGEILAVKSHLRICSDCRAVLDEMNAVTRMFQEAERVAPSPFLWNRISADLNKKDPARGWIAAVLESLHPYKRGLSAAAAALTIILAVGITFLYENSRQVAEQAALAAIDQTYKSLAAQDPDAYNPFASGSLNEHENPFSSFLSSGRTAQGN